MDREEEFSKKNTTKPFTRAIEEAKSAMSAESKDVLPKAITLKTESIQQILDSFDENRCLLERLFNERKHKLNRFNNGNGYDYLTVLWRVVSTEQQTSMNKRIFEYFIEDKEEYIQNPKVSMLLNCARFRKLNEHIFTVRKFILVNFDPGVGDSNMFKKI